jgi:hypothetical protein
MTKSKRQQRKKKKKRRFEAASTLVLGRTRVRRPSKTRHSPFAIRYSPLAIRNSLLLLLSVAAIGSLWLTLDDRFYVYHANVVGADRVSPTEVFQASGLPGLHILWARSAEIEARILAALPPIESARVVCKLPAACTITIAERQPEVTWDEDGQLWWIDAEGIIFPASPSFIPPNGEEREGTEEWLVRGPLPRDEDGRLDERVHVALTELWTAGTNMSPSLSYVPEWGLVFTDERGWPVIVGQGPGMAERLRVLEYLAADLEARGLTPQFVDVRFPDAPYYSLTNDW